MKKSNRQNKQAGDLPLVDIARARSILRSINWNFYQRGSFARHEVYPFNCRKHHWFPATFVPEIPFTLIEVLTFPGATVYDPFAGIGTTYFQALLLNRRPLATEICGVAVEYMRSLRVLFDPERPCARVRSRAKKALDEFCPAVDYTSQVHHNALIDRLRPWFSPCTLNKLSFLFLKEGRCRDLLLKSAMRISLSAILKTACSQDRGGWGCIADNVVPKDDQIKDRDVFGLFSARVNNVVRDVMAHLECVGRDYADAYAALRGEQTIFHEDVTQCSAIPDGSVDLVVTSPPYPNMTDYVTSQRLSYYYFGCDLGGTPRLKDLDLEIGARSKRSRRDSLDRYLADMQRANEVISAKMKSGAYACYVMPVFNTDNENNRSRRGVVQKVLSRMNEHDLIREDEYERILPTLKRSHNIKWATLERERIHLFRKV